MNSGKNRKGGQSRLQMLLALPVAMIILIWPMFYNGQAFFYPDTSAYIRGADAGVFALTGHQSLWSTDVLFDEAQPETVQGLAKSQVTSVESMSKLGTQSTIKSIKEKTVLSGRSVYYGALLYIGSFDNRFWLTVSVQVFLVVIAVLLTLQSCDLFTPFRVVAVAALLALTSLPLFVSFLMPDVFTSLALLSCANFLAARKSWNVWVFGFWFSLLSFSLLVHFSHVLLAVCFVAVSLILLVLRRGKVNTAGVLAIGAALFLAYAGNFAFETAVQKFTGNPPIRPPFLTARMIADGPGYRFLLDTCPDSGYTMCRFVNRLSDTVNLDEEDILWSSDPKIGIFTPADPMTRRAFAAEDYRFAAAVLRHNFIGQLVASVSNAAQQFFMIGTREFQYSDTGRHYFARKLPSNVYAVMSGTPAFRGTMPNNLLTILNYALTMIGLAGLIWILTVQRAIIAKLPGVAMPLVVWLTVGVFANDIICGSVSAQAHRYGARVAWLFPFAAMLLFYVLNAESRRQPAASR
jgi:hypothetical protein